MSQGRDTLKWPLKPAKMVEACRGLASDLRAEHAAGWPAIRVNGLWTSRADAAASADEQANRWAAEIATGEPNVIDRDRVDASRVRRPGGTKRRLGT